MDRAVFDRWLATRAWDCGEWLLAWIRSSPASPAELWADCPSIHWLNALAIRALAGSEDEVLVNGAYSRACRARTEREGANIYRAAIPWDTVERCIREAMR